MDLKKKMEESKGMIDKMQEELKRKQEEPMYKFAEYLSEAEKLQKSMRETHLKFAFQNDMITKSH